MLALIDADLVLFRVGFTTENDAEWIARARANEMIEGILLDTQASEFECWLSDARENTFRWQLWNGYKANRVKPKPVHYDFIKELLITEWDTRIAHGMEADDALGIGQRYNPDILSSSKKTVICSIDKDLMQIPGLHYNFVKKEWSEVTPIEGERSFYRSILVGDVSDNIKGCRGIGPVKAHKAIDELFDRSDYLEAIFTLYLQQEVEKTTEEILQHILLAGRLLKIKQEQEEQLWSFPVEFAI